MPLPKKRLVLVGSAVLATVLAWLVLRAPDTSLSRVPPPYPGGPGAAPSLVDARCPDCRTVSSGPVPEPPPPETVRIASYSGAPLDKLRVPCSQTSPGLDPWGPPAARGSASGQLGSELVAWTRALGRPDARSRELLTDLGATPAAVGELAARVSPWLGLAALDAQRGWTRSDPYLERDRGAELPLARQLQARYPDTEVAHRAAMYELEISPWEERPDRAVALLHQSNEPLLQAMAVIHLVGRTRPDLDDADLARFQQIVGGLPRQEAVLLSLVAATGAWRGGHRDDAVTWWREAEVHAERCGESCPCWPSQNAAMVPVFLHQGLIEPRGLEDRLGLAAARCQMAGLRPTEPLTVERRWTRVGADSALGRCIQAELGPSPVLDADLELVIEL